jgi:2,3-bisphosphoglycerate-independent phosphoglycerate mutase
MANKVALIILDGWGYGKKDRSDAIFNAHTPVFDKLLETYPNATLTTFGEEVGLPEGQMGNSEVGHLNIGAGRVVYQELARINKAVAKRELEENQVLLEAIQYARENDKPIHLMGLVSDGGIHSHQDHLIELCRIVSEKGVDKCYIHAFTDGRDTDPRGGSKHLQYVQEKTKPFSARFASVIGRYYAMDRDQRWERIKKAYDLLVYGKGKEFRNIQEVFDHNYGQEVTDEFIEPAVLVDKDRQPVATIQKGDVVLCFNFRTDRCRQITRALFIEDFPDHDMKKLELYYLTMTPYDDSFDKVKVLFDKNKLENTLGEVLSKKGKTQLRIAETEKYPHVTFFFSGGREKEWEGEKRLMIPSPKVATYDLQPEMSAAEVSRQMLGEMKRSKPDFICLNFANPDMVGHTGVYEAIVKAVETVDECLGQIINEGLVHGYSFLIIADHGNADQAMYEDGSPHTAHTMNPVPLILIDNEHKRINNGKLADVAPTILQLMGLQPPVEMNGKSLLN